MLQSSNNVSLEAAIVEDGQIVGLEAVHFLFSLLAPVPIDWLGSWVEHLREGGTWVSTSTSLILLLPLDASSVS